METMIVLVSFGFSLFSLKTCLCSRFLAAEGFGLLRNIFLAVESSLVCVGRSLFWTITVFLIGNCL